MQRETKLGLLFGMGVIIVIAVLVGDHLSVAKRQSQADLGQSVPPELRQTVLPPPVDLEADRVSDAIADAEDSQPWTFPAIQPTPPPVVRDVPSAETTADAALDSAQPGSLPLGPDILVLDGGRRDSNYRDFDPFDLSRELAEAGVADQFTGLDDDAFDRSDLSSTAIAYRIDSRDTAATGTSISSGNRQDYIYPSPQAGNTAQVRPLNTFNSSTNPSGTVAANAAPDTSATGRNFTSTSRSTTAADAPQRTHHIAQGETLSDISRQYYGTVKHVDLIVKANRDKIPNPDRVRSGVRIVIPDAPATTAAASTSTTTNRTTAATTPNPTDAGAATRTHKVAPGETLSDISRQYYGTTRHTALIVKANPGRITDADNVRSGLQIVIPTAPAAAPTTTAARPAAGSTTTASASTAALTTKTYRVQDDDTLSTIAERIYGSKAAWPKLHALNKAALPDPNRLKPGMVIHIPAQPG